MDAERWKAVRPVFEQALELDGADRAAFMEQLEIDAPHLVDEIARLLEADSADLDFDHVAESALAAFANAVADDALDEAALGERIGPFVLEKLLGAGGMGAVYRGRRTDGQFEQVVAVKLLRDELFGSGAELRFRQERDVLAQLDHVNIARLFDGGTTSQGRSFFTMEYVDGSAIDAYCRDHDPSTRERIELLLQVAAALSYAHRNLVIHRDVKPSNVLVGPNGVVKLVDFGIAKLLSNEASVGLTQAQAGPMTPEYAAPEQFLGQRITVATDIYQFGVLVFKVLTGALPYRTDPSDPVAWARSVTSEVPLDLSRLLETVRRNRAAPPVAVPRTWHRQFTRDLNAVVQKAMAKSPAGRYGSMDALIADLQALLAGRPTQARPLSTHVRAIRFIARHRIGAAITVLVTVALVTSSIIALMQAASARREAQTAQAISTFMIDLFRVADPGVNRGSRLTARQILDRGREKIRVDLSEQPREQAKLSRVIGDVLLSLGEAQRAREAYQTTIELFAANSREVEAIDHSAALARLAGIDMLAGGDVAPLRKQLETADLQLRGSEAESDQIRSEIFNVRGNLHDDSPDGRRAAARDFETAIRFGRSAKSATGMTRPMYNLSRLSEDRGDVVAARDVCAEALRIQVEALGHDDLFTLRISQRLGSLEIALGDGLQGADRIDAALERRRTIMKDVDGAMTLADSQFQLMSLVAREKFAEAVALGQKLSAESLQLNGDITAGAALVRVLVSEAYIGLHQFDRASELAESSLRDFARTNGEASAPLLRLQLQAARTALLSNEPERARNHAIAARRSALAIDGRRGVWDFEATALLGLAEYASCDVAGAEATLETVATLPAEYRPSVAMFDVVNRARRQPDEVLREHFGIVPNCGKRPASLH